jgi:Ala-tRNA(Pro) deacylase
MEALGVAPGSVTPLAMVNDTAHRVRFCLDRVLVSAEHVACHPLVNTATVSLRSTDLMRLMQAIGVEPAIIDLDRA